MGVAPAQVPHERKRRSRRRLNMMPLAQNHVSKQIARESVGPAYCIRDKWGPVD